MFTLGQIRGVTNPGWKSSGDYSIFYVYKIEGKEYRGNSNYNLCSNQTKEEIGQLLINNFFTIAYSKNNAGFSAILLTQEQAERFHYVIPDSLLVYDSLLTCIQRNDGSSPTIPEKIK